MVQDRGGDLGRRISLLQQSLYEQHLSWELSCLQRGSELVEQGVGPPALYRLRGGHLFPTNLCLGESLDRLQLVDARTRHERYRPTLSARPACTADPVDVVLGIIRQVVVDHEFEVIDVDATGGDVGRHEECKRRLLEVIHHPRPLGLRHTAVEAFGRTSSSHERVGEFLDHLLRVAEDQAALDVVKIDQPSERVKLCVMPDLVIDLIDQRRPGDNSLLDLHQLGVTGMTADQRLDGRGNGRREKHRLPLGGGRREDLLDILPESHVEHPVGLVEHHQLHPGQVERVAGQMVRKPSWRAHHDVRAPLQFDELPFVGCAPVNRHRSHALLADGEFVNLVGDLGGQLPGGSEDQHLRNRFRRVDPLDRRNAKRGGLARSRLRLADHVVSSHDQRNRRRLDRRGLLETEPGDGLDHFG